MAQTMEKRTRRKREPKAQFAVEKTDTKNMDRISAKMLVADAAGYGCSYGKFESDHPDAFKNWEPGDPLPVVPHKKCKQKGRHHNGND